MKHIFHKARTEVASKNKKEIDKLIHTTVVVEYKNCTVTWREVKNRVAENEEDFVSRLRELYRSDCRGLVQRFGEQLTDMKQTLWYDGPHAS